MRELPLSQRAVLGPHGLHRGRSRVALTPITRLDRFVLARAERRTEAVQFTREHGRRLRAPCTALAAARFRLRVGDVLAEPATTHQLTFNARSLRSRPAVAIKTLRKIPVDCMAARFASTASKQ